MTRVSSMTNKMTDSRTELNACTENDLEEVLAGLLMRARAEVLNDTEVQEFWKVYQEIQRRRGNSA